MKIPVFSFLLSLILSVLAAISPLEAQENLVPNGDFEEYTECPTSSALLSYAKPWYQANFGTADLFNSCVEEPYVFDFTDVPNNIFGYQQAFSGNGYASLGLRDTENYRFEYCTTALKQPLIANQFYCLEFSLSLNDIVCLKTNEIQILFSSDSIRNSSNIGYIISQKPSLKIDISSVNATDWKTFNITYEAIGGESFISFGHFDSTSTTLSVVCVDSVPQLVSGYYLDAVSLTENNGNCETLGSLQIPNVFSPNGDGMNDIFFIDANMRLQILNRWGQVLFVGDSRTGWDGKWNDIEMATGVYFYVLTDEKDNTKTGYFHLWR